MQDAPVNGYICAEVHPRQVFHEQDGETKGLRCWKRKGHDLPHMTVEPNHKKDVLTRPTVLRWGSAPLQNALG